MTTFKNFLRRSGQDEGGQGLGYLLAICAVLMILLVALVDVIQHEMRWLTGTARRHKLLGAADAAVEKALYALQRGSNWNALPLEYYNNDYTHTDIPGIKYTVLIQEGNWTPYSGENLAQGLLPDFPAYEAGGNLKTERTVTILLSYTTTGERKKVQGIVIKSGLNSAMYAEGTVSLGGSADVYWGPVVSYDETVPMEIPSYKGTCNPPPHPIFISRGPIEIGGTDVETGCPGKDDPDPYAGETVNASASDTELGDEPDLDTDGWKNSAKDLDKHPDWMEADRNYYFSGVASWSFTSMTKVPWPSKTVYGETVVFFDTVDGLPCDGTIPKDGSCVRAPEGDCINATEVSFQGGGSNCGAGVLVVMGDLSMGGSGVCTWNAIPPSNCEKMGGPCTAPGTPYVITKGWWEGDIWVGGVFDAQGGKKIYGTIGVGSAAGGLGGVEIWFKSGSATLGALGQSLGIKYWRERKREHWDIFP